ncbi:MAG: hypothetical protein C0596_05125 [Marinilabiliales bacterium]|nr:MAG: hypothetical protein C0596_05125 [Marinilabiliales bacterium]
MIEINLEKFRQLVEAKREENQRFRFFLEKQNPKPIDEIVHRLNREVTAKVDCVQCGNCCHNIRPVATDEELLQYVKPENLEELRYAYSIVCKNLNGNACTIYPNRYFECRAFPYLDRENFIQRIVGVLNNYELCPIVYHVVEELKLELNWKGNR